MRELSGIKICFLAGTLEHGGAERQLFYWLRALCDCGAAPRVLCLDRGEFWETPIKNLGVPVTWVGEHASRLKRLIRIIRDLRKDPPDVFQSQHFFANAYVSLAASLLGASAIGAMRSDGLTDVLESGRAGGWLNLHLPGMLAANSRRAIRYATSRGIAPSRLYFLPNVVDTEHFKPAESNAQDPLTLLTVGRLVKEKRLDRFLSILARLRIDFHLDVRGLIVGPAREDEDLRVQLEHQAKKLRLFPDGVQFQGAVSDMAPLYQQAAVCVLTSDNEGTPNVLLEAMSSGVPVVATRVGGVPEIIRHQQTGFVCDRDDQDGFVAALLQLARNPQLRAEMGCRARAWVEENHSLHRLPARLSELYRLACSEKYPQSEPSPHVLPLPSTGLRRAEVGKNLTDREPASATQAERGPG